MSDDRKFSAPSTSKQIESGEQNVYDVEKLIEDELSKAGIQSYNKDRFVFWILILQ